MSVELCRACGRVSKASRKKARLRDTKIEALTKRRAQLETRLEDVINQLVKLGVTP